MLSFFIYKLPPFLPSLPWASIRGASGLTLGGHGCWDFGRDDCVPPVLVSLSGVWKVDKVLAAASWTLSLTLQPLGLDVRVYQGGVCMCVCVTDSAVNQSP